MNKRAFNREEKKARIKYTVYGTDKETEAVMRNTSDGGLFFESDGHIAPGSQILFTVTLSSAEDEGLETGRNYSGEVMWCRRMYKPDDPSKSYYGVGVRLMVDTCSQCERKVGRDNLRQAEDDFVFLCRDCYKKLQKLPKDGKLREAVSEHLIGNVV